MAFNSTLNGNAEKINCIVEWNIPFNKAIYLNIIRLNHLNEILGNNLIKALKLNIPWSIRLHQFKPNIIIVVSMATGQNVWGQNTIFTVLLVIITILPHDKVRAIHLLFLLLGQLNSIFKILFNLANKTLCFNVVKLNVSWNYGVECDGWEDENAKVNNKINCFSSNLYTCRLDTIKKRKEKNILKKAPQFDLLDCALT